MIRIFRVSVGMGLVRSRIKKIIHMHYKKKKNIQTQKNLLKFTFTLEVFEASFERQVFLDNPASSEHPHKMMLSPLMLNSDNAF